MKVVSYPELMLEMLADTEASERIYRAGPYWRPHAEKMVDVVRRVGIENFRGAPEKVLSAFATAVFLQPARFASPRFWRLHDLMRRIPLARRIAAKYEAEIEAGYDRARQLQGQKNKLIFALVKEIAPDLLTLPDSASGAAELFDIDGKKFSEVFLSKLLELAFLRRQLNFESIRTVVEVGGSYGLLGEILLKRYPHLKYVLVDIAPVSAFAEYHLRLSFGDQVFGYREAKSADGIDLSSPGHRAFVLCSHQLGYLNKPIDLFINIGSFQEMAREQVLMYIEFAKRSCGSAYINNRYPPRPMGHGFEFYKEYLLPMRLVSEWPDLQRGNYHPALFRTF